MFEPLPQCKIDNGFDARELRFQTAQQVHVQRTAEGSETNDSNWKKNRCAESPLTFQQKIAYDTIYTSEFDEVEHLCIDGCWNTLQGQVNQGSYLAFLRQCRECCGFYPPDAVQRCSDECNRLEEQKKDVGGDIDRLMGQLSGGIAAIMAMLETFLDARRF